MNKFYFLINFHFKLIQISRILRGPLCINISSVVEFQQWWVLKSKLSGQESTCHQGKIFEKFLPVMTVGQKLGVILESKLDQKLSLEKKFLINNGLLK